MMAIQELKNLHIRLDQGVLKVLMDCPTRWNCTYYMLERLVCIKDSSSLYATVNKIEQLDSEDWALIQEIMRILKPLEEATEKFSSSNTLTSDVIPLVRTLNKMFDKMTQSIENEETGATRAVHSVISSLKTELNRRFAETYNNNLYLIATFLVPRYKGKFFSDYVNRELLRFWKNMTAMFFTTAKTSNEQLQAAKKEECATLINSMASMLSSDDEPDDQIHDMNSQLKEYTKEKRLQRDRNPLKYWDVNWKKFAFLGRMARAYLSAPATSVLSEQFFSASGIVYDPY